MADYTRGTDLVSALKYYMSKGGHVVDVSKLADCHSELDCWRLFFGYEGEAKNLVELFNALGDNSTAQIDIPGGQVVNPVNPGGGNNNY